MYCGLHFGCLTPSLILPLNTRPGYVPAWYNSGPDLGQSIFPKSSTRASYGLAWLALAVLRTGPARYGYGAALSRHATAKSGSVS